MSACRRTARVVYHWLIQLGRDFWTMFAQRKKRRDLQQGIASQREKLSPLLHEIYDLREHEGQSEKVEALGEQIFEHTSQV